MTSVIKLAVLIVLIGSVHGVTAQESPYCVPHNATCWPTANEWTKLKVQLSGTLKPLRSSDYGSCEDQGNNAFNIASTGSGMCMQYHDCSKAFCNKNEKWNIPAYSVEARDVDDIKAALSFADKYNIAVTVKTSGHSYSGSSMGDGTLLIWMHSFKKYGNIKNKFDNTCNKEFSNVLHIGGGQTWKEAYDVVGERFHISGGGCPTVSAAGGWLMGGGLSALARNIGMGVDNVIQFEIVLADGRHVTADACTNSDLFWAVRGGGGGTFGVVASVHYQLHPVTPIVLVTIHITDIERPPHPTKIVNSFIDFWVEKAPHLDQRWGGYWTLNWFSLFFQGSMEDAKSTFIEDLEKWKQSLNLHILVSAYTVPIVITTYNSYYAWRLTNPADKTGEKEFNIANRLVPVDLVVQKPAEVKETLKWMVHNGFFTFNYFLGGVMTKVGASQTSVNPAYRKALWQIETFDERLIQKLRSFVVKDTGSGYNHASKNEPDWENAFWGSNLPRLQALKRKYDPKNRFNCWHCIGYQGRNPSASVKNKLSLLVMCLCFMVYYLVL